MSSLREIGQGLESFFQTHGKMMDGEISMLDVSISHILLWVVISFFLVSLTWLVVVSLFGEVSQLRDDLGLEPPKDVNNENKQIEDWVINWKRLCEALFSLLFLYLFGKITFHYFLETLMNQ